MITAADALRQIERLGCLGIAYNAMNEAGLAELVTALQGAVSPYMASQIIGEWIDSGTRNEQGHVQMPLVTDIKAAIHRARQPAQASGELERLRAACPHCDEGSGWKRVKRGGYDAVVPCEACRTQAVASE